MKSSILTVTALLVFNLCHAQFEGHNKNNIQLYFGDMLEQGKWDFEKEYRWSFYICADDVIKLSEAQKELSNAGFSGFQIIPNSVSSLDTETMLNMLVFEKNAIYTPQTLHHDITMFYTLENNFGLSSFDDYGNYELQEEVNTATASAKTRIF